MLSDLMVRQAKTTGKTYTWPIPMASLFVAANGAKAWHFRFTWGGKRDRMSFGSYPALSLKEARELRDEARKLLAGSVNPRIPNASASATPSCWRANTRSRRSTTSG